MASLSNGDKNISWWYVGVPVGHDVDGWVRGVVTAGVRAGRRWHGDRAAPGRAVPRTLRRDMMRKHRNLRVKLIETKRPTIGLANLELVL